MHFHGEGEEENEGKQESLRFSSLTFADETSSSEDVDDGGNKDDDYEQKEVEW